MINEKVRQHVIEYNKKNDWHDDSDESIIETIVECSEQVHREFVDSRRWWDEYQYVVQLDGMLIGYIGAETTGDDSPKDKGFEFDSSSIEEMESYTETIEITRYRPV